MNDSSTASRQIQIEAIRQSIASGDLTAQQIHNTLLSEITAELSKSQEEVDIDYVNACQEFLMELNSSRVDATQSHYEQNLAAIRKIFQPCFSFVPHTIWGRLATVLCLVVLITTAGLLMPEGWIITRQSEDEGQYIMQGVETPNGLRSVAEAGPALSNIGYHRTANWKEAVTILGGIPHVPTWMPSNWSVYEYGLELSNVLSSFTITYQNDTTGAGIVYETTVYFALDQMTEIVEQNERGEYVTIANGTQIYVSSNFDYISATWNTNNTSYFLGGTITEEQLIRIIESIN